MTQLTTVQAKVNNVRALLEKAKPQIALALPKHMTADRMMRVALTAILRTPKLLECDQASLGAAIITCAQLGLEPDPLLGHAHLVPFRNRRRGVTEVTVILGYKGLMKLARNSGEIATIDAHAVRKHDTFKYAYGLKPTLYHVPSQGPPSDEPATHYYAVATWKSGGGQFIVMTAAEVDAHRDRFVKNIDDDSPWRSDYDAMAMKTCIRMLAKYLPASVELQRAAALDEQAEAGIPQDLSGMIDVTGVVVPPEDGNGYGAAGDTSTAPAASKLDALTEQLEQQPPAPGTTTDPEAEAARQHADAVAAIVTLLGNVTDIERAVLREHVGSGDLSVLDTADPAALSDLKTTLVKRQNATAKEKK